MAIITFRNSFDISYYYMWFIKKRYGLELSKPLRGAHVSIINDSIRDINGGKGSEEERQALWESVVKKYDGKKIDVTVDLDPLTQGEHWWFRVSYDHREEIMDIRNELGLGVPFYGLHMTIGLAVDKRPDEGFIDGAVTANRMNAEHSKYIHTLVEKGYLNYDS